MLLTLRYDDRLLLFCIPLFLQAHSMRTNQQLAINQRTNAHPLVIHIHHRIHRRTIYNQRTIDRQWIIQHNRLACCLRQHRQIRVRRLVTGLTGLYTVLTQLQCATPSPCTQLATVHINIRTRLRSQSQLGKIRLQLWSNNDRLAFGNRDGSRIVFIFLLLNLQSINAPIYLLVGHRNSTQLRLATCHGIRSKHMRTLCHSIAVDGQPAKLRLQRYNQFPWSLSHCERTFLRMVSVCRHHIFIGTIVEHLARHTLLVQSQSLLFTIFPNGHPGILLRRNTKLKELALRRLRYMHYTRHRHHQLIGTLLHQRRYCPLGHVSKVHLQFLKTRTMHFQRLRSCRHIHPILTRFLFHVPQ